MLFCLNEYSKAENYLNKAIEILEKNEKLNTLYDAYTFLAELHSLTDDYKKAYEFSNKSKEILIKI